MMKNDTKNRPIILVVDDTPGNLKYLSELLGEEGYEVRATPDGQMALQAARLSKPDLILLDIRMPGMDGYAVCKELQSDALLHEVPIIFISALDDVNDKIKAFESGGVDYITKPFEANEVLARVNVQLQLYQGRQQIASLLRQQDWFIKKIMHEMNTPLSVISLNAQTLEGQIGPKSQLETIKASAKTLASIYDDLSYMVKKECSIYESKPICMIDFLSERIAFFHEIAAVKEIEIHFEIESEYTLHINPIELQRLVDNTLSNAIKYSGEKSPVEVLLSEKEGKQLLQISDQGIGIDDVNLIFEPYYQASGNHIGLGIGMVTVKDICEKYGIALTIVSEKNRGSVFAYTFPEKMVHLS